MDSSMMRLVRNELCFYSSLQFQNKAAIILKEYYRNLKLTYENPNPAGGDDKNDGWVVETGIYYQVYAPTNYSDSFVSDVFRKFEEDATGLFNNVYNRKLWKAPINEFIFIVNTRDQSTPKDSKLRCKSCIDSLNRRYGSSAKFKLVNVDYLVDLILEINNYKVERNILIKLEIDGMLNYSNLDEKVMLRFLDLLSSNIQEQTFSNIGSDYVRISSEKKIKINSLNEYSDKINTMIRRLDIVEKAISTYEKTNPMDDVAEKTTKLVINLYDNLKDSYEGIRLYDQILAGIMDVTSQLSSFKYAAEFFIIYVFDKCDIFEKEAK